MCKLPWETMLKKPWSRTEEDWSVLREIVWISLIAIVQAAPRPQLESLKQGQCVITVVYSPLHCKQSQFQPASTSPETQQMCRLHSKVGLHTCHTCSPTRRDQASCMVPCSAEVPLGLCPWTRACWMTHGHNDHVCKHRFKHTISWRTAD